MMRHSRRTLIALLALFAALAAGLTVQNQQLADAPPAIERTFIRVFPDLEVLNIISVRLLDPATEASFTIQRGADGTWELLDSPGTLAENAGSNIARTIALLPYERTAALPAEADLADYGFEPTPVLLVQVVLIDGSSHGIAVGGLSASGTGFYALVDDRQEMYLLVPEAVAYLIAQLETPPVA
jgi:hypothetical protein